MPSSAPIAPGRLLSRRRFVGVTVGATGLLAAGGCALPSSVVEPDPLLELAESARRDAEQFSAADALHGDHVRALHRLAAVRRTHADRLDELTGGLLTAVTSTPGPERDPGTPAVCPPIDEVRSRLRDDAVRAADVVVDLEDTRAEVVAAVSAACTAAVEVVLA